MHLICCSWGEMGDTIWLAMIGGPRRHESPNVSEQGVEGARLAGVPRSWTMPKGERMVREATSEGVDAADEAEYCIASPKVETIGLTMGLTYIGSRFIG